MKAFVIAMAAVGFVYLAAGPAAADHSGTTSPCCEAKPCPAGQTAVKGDSPAQAQCCVDPGDPTTCTASANAGWACNAFPNPDDPTVIGVGSGCIDGPADPASCTGGDAKVPAGCICVAGTCTTDNCTPSAVDACCADDACH